jgi:hypothetical protein
MDLPATMIVVYRLESGVGTLDYACAIHLTYRVLNVKRLMALHTATPLRRGFLTAPPRMIIASSGIPSFDIVR